MNILSNGFIYQSICCCSLLSPFLANGVLEDALLPFLFGWAVPTRWIHIALTATHALPGHESTKATCLVQDFVASMRSEV